jgi:hypothetical protein
MKVGDDTRKTEEWVRMYIAQLTPKQRLGHEIATEQLGGSYSVERSVSFLQWKQKQFAEDTGKSDRGR